MENNYKAMYALLCGAIDDVLDPLNKIPQARPLAVKLQYALLQAEELFMENGVGPEKLINDPENISIEHLRTWSVQELKQLLLAELSYEETHVELIKNATKVISEQDEKNSHDVDPEVAYQDFLQIEKQEPLFDL